MRSRKENTLIFDFSQTTDIESIVAELSKKYRVVKDTNLKTRLVYFDTFDWRLYNKNLSLIKKKHSFFLIKKSTSADLCSLTTNSDSVPSFWWDFDKSTLKTKLQPVLDLRSLMPLISILKTSQTYRLLNKDDKTVLRINFEMIRSAARSKDNLQIQLLLVTPLKGYDHELKIIKSSLNAIGLKQCNTDYIDLLINKSGKIPSDYSSKLNINLLPEMSTKNALTTILKNLLGTIKKNEDGIKKDIDTEFLHDFRVAVRKTRSALSLIKGVFDKDELRIHKLNISKLGKATNALRDLDVYLLKEKQYKKLIPQAQHKGLESIFQKLKEQRKSELTKLRRFLNSKHYKKIISDWEDFLNTGGQTRGEAEIRTKNVLTIAKRIINKKHKEILKAGTRINDKSPDDKLHALRIECKKLRYMIEFFSSLFPKDEINRFIRQLKKLQDNLGDFNDLYVQQQSLKEFSDKFDSHSKDITISIGGLIAVLYRKQKETKKQFGSSFELFASKENTGLFNKMFKEKTS